MTSPKAPISIEPRALADFLGEWTLEKTIQQADGQIAKFRGTATWVKTDQGAAFQETGHLILQGQPPMQAKQTYHWTDDLKVWFSDGRFFHQVPETGGSVHHDCAPDTYVGAYRFDAWPHFQTEWRVTGPRKDYVMTSTFSKI